MFGPRASKVKLIDKLETALIRTHASLPVFKKLHQVFKHEPVKEIPYLTKNGFSQSTVRRGSAWEVEMQI